MQAILGTKLGMTQIFDDDGQVHPVTVIQAGPCAVVQRKTTESDGYDAAQLGLIGKVSRRKLTKAMNGHFKSAGVASARQLVEVRLAAGDQVQAGDEIGAGVFAADDLVDVTAVSKGKGFQGVIRRHGHSGGGATHGSMFHRAPGSIGQASDPSRVFPGVKLPGRMGGKRITTKNLRVVKVDEEKGLLFIRGAVPGPKSGFVSVIGVAGNPERVVEAKPVSEAPEQAETEERLEGQAAPEGSETTDAGDDGGQAESR